MYCDKQGIKYIHAVECYLTRSHQEKVRDNYHTILIGKNEAGRKELNKLISLAKTDEAHMYYVGRLSFDEFLNISDNVIKISACLASPLNKVDYHDPIYEKLAKHYDYYEIQPHNCQDQILYNQHLAMLSKKYNKPLIAGTDAHSVNSYKAECRNLLLLSKKKSYGNEDEFDLTYKSYDELVNAFKEQDAIPEEMYMEAINNTNVMADSVEDFKLDTSLKYPILYGSAEEDKRKFRETIDRKFKDKIEKGIIHYSQVPAFKQAIEEEFRVFEKLEMCGFMLSMSEIISWCRDNGYTVGTARGSVGGSRIAYITDIIDLNPETWHTVFSRFCNEDRKEVGDIDVDVILEERPEIFKYIIDRFTQPYTARVPAFGTAAETEALLIICRGFKEKWIKEHPDEDEGNCPYNNAFTSKMKKSLAKGLDEAKKEYPEVFYYYDGILGTRISQSVHPAGIVISPVLLAENYGTFLKDGEVCLQIDMDEIHDVSLVKYDLLALRTVKIISNTCKLIGCPYPKTYEIDWNDEKVWNDMLRTNEGLFQMESAYAFGLLKQFKPKSIFDMSLVCAALRPSGASYRDDLIKGVKHKNPSKMIDDLLADNNGYLVYQEDVIKFLQNICGLSGSEADNVRRAIGRKDEQRLQKALPQILNGYCEKSDKPREVAEEEAKAFIQILIDASSYMFGYNHSIAYCLLSYLCAYYRYYYPYEFVTASLNCATSPDHIQTGTAIAKEYGVKISPPVFGASSAEYAFNKEEHIIAKGVATVKYLNADVAKQLYDLYPNIDHKYFNRTINCIVNETSTNSRQIEILIKINYFKMYGNEDTLLAIYEMCDDLKYGSMRTIKKDSPLFEKYPALRDFAEKHFVGVNDKGQQLKTYTVKDLDKAMDILEESIKDREFPDWTYKQIIEVQEEYLNYVDLITNNPDDRTKLFVHDVHPLVSQYSKNKEPWGYAIFTRSIGTGKEGRITVRSNIYNRNPISKSSVIQLNRNDLYKDKNYWNAVRYQILA